MHKSSFIEIIRTFSPKELIKFGDMLSSPYFNKNKNLIKLFDEIKKYAPSFDDDNLEKEKVWNKMFPGKEYNYGIMKNLIHELTGLCEMFITLEYYVKAEYKYEMDLINSLYFRDLPKLSLSKTKSFENSFKKEFDNNNIFSFTYYLENSVHVNDLKQRLIYYYADKRDNFESIDLACEHLLYCFLYESFIFFQNILQLKLTGNKTKPENLLELFFKNLEESEFFNDLFDLISKKQDKISQTVIGFYYWYKTCSTTDNSEHYFRFKNFLKENITMFPVDEWDSLYQGLATGLSNINLPNLENSIETFEINQMIISNKMLFANGGLINFTRFISIIENACCLSKTDFAEKFYHEHYRLLPDELKECVGYYSQARIRFAKSDYGETLNLLSRIQNEPLMLKYFAKNIYMMTLYEKNDVESFEFALDSFRHFAKRNKLSHEASFISYSTFCNYIKTFFKLRENFDRYEFDILTDMLKKNKSAHVMWLNEKLAQIESINK